MRFQRSTRNRQGGAATTWVFATFAAIALFFLVTEHRAHLYGWLPFLFLAACPLMHLFHGHGGHGHGNHSGRDEPRRDDSASGTQTPSGPDAATPAAHHHH